ncbi:MAG: hypothetical protein JXR85_00645 [Deltaproteobacteria bacterium]|nr:hypothetical protein [Deltaproteobacteria bacterium]
MKNILTPVNRCLFTFFLFVSFLLLLPLSVQAHPPGTVTLQYDPDAKVLTVTITHSVADGTKHYIESVTIARNGELVKTFEYKSQPDKKTFTYEYLIETQKGDELKVRAGCNYFGSKTNTLIVGESK